MGSAKKKNKKEDYAVIREWVASFENLSRFVSKY